MAKTRGETCRFPPRTRLRCSVLFPSSGLASRPDKPGSGHEQLLEVEHPKPTSSSCLAPGYRAAVGLQLSLISWLRTRKLRLRVNGVSAPRTGSGLEIEHLGSGSR